MTPVDYNTFLANVDADDLALLTGFSVGVESFANTPELGDAMFVKVQRLYDAGLLLSASRRYFDDSGVQTQGFLATLHPTAVGYIGQLARERVTLSRDPLP